MHVLDPLVIILLLAGVASAVLGEVSNAVIIGLIVSASTGLNWWQTHRSSKAIARLRDQVASRAAVLQRDGSYKSVAVADVAVGDVVQLAAGDIVPADARVIEARDLHVQQAALTGESLPVEKLACPDPPTERGPDAIDLLFFGTSVVSGTAKAKVLAVGKDTAYGDIVSRLSARPAESEFDRGTRHFGLFILRTVVFLILFILVIHVALGRDPMQSLLFSVALAVGLTPGFLPMISTVTLARGAVAMARQKVIVRHLPSIQNLGSIDILCSDKTGTLTRGTMSLAASCDGLGATAARPLQLAALNSRFESGIKSPLDAAILEDHTVSQLPFEQYTKEDELPFDFERRRLTVVVAAGHEHLFISKGAPEGMLEVCTHIELEGRELELDAALRARCLETFHSLSAQGYRVLAVAFKRVTTGSGFTTRDERELTLVGFLTFMDHPLSGVGASIEQLRRDGVNVKILTGDNELVTRHVCAQVGLDAERVVLGSELEDLDRIALGKLAERTVVFARLSPAQKHRVVAALKAAGHVVGYMGDGINDAPSLHEADVGISVEGAVDVAREAADIVLLDHDLGVLHKGILAGRRSSANVLKYLLMGTSSNFGNMFSMAAAALFLPFLPMLPTQILLNGLLYDLAQITIPTDGVDSYYLSRPQRWDIGLIRRFMLVIGPISSIYDCLTFWALLKYFDFGEVAFHTGWFLESLCSQTLVLFVIRTTQRPWASRPSLPLMLTTGIVISVALLLPYTPLAPLLGFTPLPLEYLLFLAVVVLSYLALVEVIKRAVMTRFLFGRPNAGLA